MPALKERHTDHPCPILEELIVGVFVLFCLFVLGFVFLLLLLLFRFVFSSGKGYMVVRTIGLSPHCFWDCPCWPCSVSMPIIPHWSDYLGRNGIYLFLIDFCPSVYQIHLYMNVPVGTPNVCNWKYSIFLHSVSLIYFEPAICKQPGSVSSSWSSVLPRQSWSWSCT